MAERSRIGRIVYKKLPRHKPKERNRIDPLMGWLRRNIVRSCSRIAGQAQNLFFLAWKGGVFIDLPVAESFGINTQTFGEFFLTFSKCNAVFSQPRPEGFGSFTR